MAKLYANGTVTITVSATHKLAIQSDDTCKVYQKVGYPNFPDSWDLLATTTAGSQYLSAAFSAETTVRIDAGASDAIYATGTAPVSDEFAYIDGVTPGTAAAGKAVILDANKDVGDIRNLDCTNLDAGLSGTAGSVDVFPATASKGKLAITCANQTGDTTVTLNANAMGQATQVNLADPGAAASYVAQSTAALTLAEVDVLDGATAGTQVASKAVIADANINTGVSKVTELHIGASGAETQVTSTAAELNILDGATATFTEINYLDLTTGPGTQEASKAVVADANVNTGVSKVTQLHIGASGAETQVTATAAELNYNDITAAGTAEASKAVVTDANIDVGGLRNVTATGYFDAPALKVDAVTVSPIKWVDIAVTAATLDGAGTAAVIAGVAGDQYKIRDIILVGGGTNYGAGGDRLIDLTDGTTVWTQIANADIEAAPAASLKWGDTKVPLLTGTSNTASVAGQDIRFVYSGGTTDHGGVGSITFSVCLEKVA